MAPNPNSNQDATTTEVVESVPHSEVSVKDNSYWNAYYSAHNVPSIPSPFATFMLSSIDKSKNLVELGCGNGRDAFFFARNHVNVIALDLSKDAIDHNNSFGHENVSFGVADFTAMAGTSFENVGNIYSRFTLHSVDYASYNRTLDWCKESLEKNGMLFLEARTVNDPLCGTGTKGQEKGEWSTTHYRRFMEVKEVMEDVQKRGFELAHASENFTDSWYKDDHAAVYRIIAKKI